MLFFLLSLPGLLDTQVQKVARVRAPKGALPNDNYCIEDKMWVSTCTPLIAVDDSWLRVALFTQRLSND